MSLYSSTFTTNGVNPSLLRPPPATQPPISQTISFHAPTQPAMARPTPTQPAMANPMPAITAYQSTAFGPPMTFGVPLATQRSSAGSSRQSTTRGRGSRQHGGGPVRVQKLSITMTFVLVPRDVCPLFHVFRLKLNLYIFSLTLRQFFRTPMAWKIIPASPTENGLLKTSLFWILRVLCTHLPFAILNTRVLISLTKSSLLFMKCWPKIALHSQHIHQCSAWMKTNRRGNCGCHCNDYNSNLFEYRTAALTEINW